jgi:hypothetical protein
MLFKHASHALIALAGLFLTACATEVVPAGPDTYSVSASGGPWTQSSAPIRAKVFKAANAFCVERNLVMVPVSVDERPYELGRHTANIDLVFRALPPGDPEIKRPNVEAPNSTQRIQYR